MRLRDRLAAAVHDNRPHADAGHERDVGQHPLRARLLLHRAAADLDDNHLAPEPLDIGQRLDEDVGLLYDVLHGPRL
jgi:hypothetical protein